MKAKLKQYSHLLLLLYLPVYLIAFNYIEHLGSHKIHIIECSLDHKIPFIEYFIVPYFLWFAYIFFGCLYFLIREKESFVKFMYLGMIGMTVFVVVSLLYPNGLDLRPTYFAHDNIFVDLTKYLYSIDTSTNVFPSIHVFNSLAMASVIFRSEKLKKHKIVQAASLILCGSIILATMFLKQHSVFDVISASVLFYASYVFVYSHAYGKSTVLLSDTEYHKIKETLH